MVLRILTSIPKFCAVGFVSGLNMVVTSSALLAIEHVSPPVAMTATCNAHGAALEIHEGPLAGATVYMGKNRDTASPGRGEGRWWTAASGYIIQLGDRSWRFEGDPPCF